MYLRAKHATGVKHDGRWWPNFPKPVQNAAGSVLREPGSCARPGAYFSRTWCERQAMARAFGVWLRRLALAASLLTRVGVLALPAAHEHWRLSIYVITFSEDALLSALLSSLEGQNVSVTVINTNRRPLRRSRSRRALNHALHRPQHAPLQRSAYERL